MIYTLRAVLVSCSVFFLVYICTSLAIGSLCRPRLLARGSQIRSARRIAKLLYSIRISPAVIAAATVAAFTVPSFLRFEPLVSDESLGVFPVAFTLGLLLVVAFGTWRAWRAYARTQLWLRCCVSMGATRRSLGSIAVVSSTKAAPVAMAGLRQPVILISPEADAVLSKPELRCAIAHELAHARAGDNLKKLVLHLCAFPGMAALERAWMEAAEFAADAAAVKSEADAVELASALIKVSRLRGSAIPAIASGFCPSGPTRLLASRVERLLHRDPNRDQDASAHGAWNWMMSACGCAMIFIILLQYGAFLRAAHQCTELLVR